MPKARHITAYPYQAYYAIFEKVHRTREPHTIATDARMKAVSLRGELYAFRRACLARPDEAKELGIALSALLDVVIRPSENGLQIIHRDETAGAQLALESLKQAGIGLEARRALPPDTAAGEVALRTAAEESAARVRAAYGLLPDGGGS